MELIIFGLQAFADAGGAAGAAASDAGTQGGGAEAQTAETGAQEQPKEAKKSLRELIRSDPDYKREYDETFRSQLDRRFKERKAVDERLAKYDELLPYLAQNYGIADDDLDGVAKAIKSDDKLFARKAVENGTTGKAEREAFERDLEAKRIMAENAALREQRQREQEEAKNRAIADRWRQEVPQTAAKYPGFDFDREYQSNPLFRQLVHLIPVTDAYEQVHRSEIDAALVAQAHRAATEQVAESVAANKSRPAEGGLARPAAAEIKVDPRTLSKEQRLNIRQRVKRGEKVTFT